MISPESLLSKDPVLAIQMMAAHQLGNEFNHEWLVLKEVVSKPGTAKTIVHLDLNELTVPYHQRHNVRQPLMLAFDKMDVSLLNVNGPIPLHVSSIFPARSYLELLQDHFNNTFMVLTEDDVEDLYPDPSDTHITIRDQSLRWYGDLAVNVNLIVEDINRFIKHRELILLHDVDYRSSNIPFLLTESLNNVNVTLIPQPLSTNLIEEVSIPRAVGLDTGKTNTEIDLRFSYPYSGILTVTYNRLSFYRTYSHRPIIRGRSDLTTDEVIAQLNSILSTTLTVDDLVPFEIPTVERPDGVYIKDGTLMLTIVPESLGYYGNIWIELNHDYTE